jgi:EpsI family protein
MSTSMPQLARTAAAQPLPPVSRWHVAVAIALMLLCLVGAELIKPSRYAADETGVPDLERLIPAKFGEWVQSGDGANTVVNPQQEAALNELYAVTLSRTYRHQPTGRVLMLALAYGKDQSLATQVHTPEACYPSQGFRIEQSRNVDLNTPFGSLKAVQMNTSMGLRIEPLTYFVRAGDQVARGSLERNLVRLRFAARGYLADGMLFRVSEITTRPDAHPLQERFINDLLNALPPAGRRQLLGQSAP